MPAYVADAEELDFEVGTLRDVPPPEPLVPHDQLRALIGDLIAAPVPGDPDIPRLVDALARGSLPRVLPRHRRKGTAHRIHVLVDTADSMRLFHWDAAALVNALRNIAGPAICSNYVIYGPPTDDAIPGAVRGDTLLILSDLGLGGRASTKRARVAAWRDFSTHQRSRGLNLTAVVPYHFGRWPASLKRRLRMIHWHRPGAVSVPATASQMRRLATALSLAAVIDPAILRRARTNILPLADAGAENDLAIERWTAVYNPRVIAFTPSWTIRLRSELADDPELLVAAEHLLQRPYSRDWERVVFEEKIIRWSLGSERRNPELVKTALARIIRSLLGRMHNADSARWALCLLEELPEEIQESEAAQLLRATASVVLHAPDEEVLKIVSDYNASWVFGEQVDIGVTWTGEYIVARDPALVSDRIVKVPKTYPRVVIVEDPSRTRQKVLRVFVKDPYPAWTGSAELPRIIKTPTGAEYRMDDARELWQTLVHIFEERQVLTGVITRFVRQRNAYAVDIGFDALLPENEISPAFDHLSELAGEEVQVRIEEIDVKKREIKVSLVTPPQGVAVEHTRMPGRSVPEDVWNAIHFRYCKCDVVPGTVISAREGRWSVEVLGVQFFVARADLTAADIENTKELIGSTVDFFIRDVDEKKRQVAFSRRFDQFEPWRNILIAFRSNQSITGTVTNRVKGGMNVLVGKIKAFLPGSLTDVKQVHNLDALVGKELSFKIVTVDVKRKNVVVSRREILEEQYTRQKDAVYGSLENGRLIRGVVKSIMDYGVFVDLGGADGLLHNTDLSWGRITHPSEILSVGDPIEVTVLKFDRETERISLGYKQKGPDPWLHAAERYLPGSQVHGRVVSITDYGAFVEVEHGIEGLIHVSEMSGNLRPPDPHKRIAVGDEVDAVVMGVDLEKRRIALSQKRLDENRWADVALRYTVGSVVTGTVVSLVEDGAFIELEPGVEGIIHRSDFVGLHVQHPGEMFMLGETVQAKVIRVDAEAHRCVLSIKEFRPNQLSDFAKSYKIGDEVEGTIIGIIDSGVIVLLAGDVEALLHNSEIPGETSVMPSKLFKTGVAIRARIIKLSDEEGLIGLSLFGVTPLES